MDDNFPLNCAGILGKNFLKSNNCEINYEQGVIKIKNIKNSRVIEIPILFQNTKLIIPNRSEKFIIAPFNVPTDGIYYCKSQQISPGVYSANSIVQVKNKLAPLSIVNTTEEEINIKNWLFEAEDITNFNIFYTNQLINDNLNENR